MLYFSVHDSAEKNNVVGNLNTFSEPPQPVHQPNVPLSDIVTAVLPFIKKLKFILENPIKVRRCLMRGFVFCAMSYFLSFWLAERAY